MNKGNPLSGDVTVYLGKSPVDVGASKVNGNSSISQVWPLIRCIAPFYRNIPVCSGSKPFLISRAFFPVPRAFFLSYREFFLIHRAFFMNHRDFFLAHQVFFLSRRELFIAHREFFLSRREFLLSRRGTPVTRFFPRHYRFGAGLSLNPLG